MDTLFKFSREEASPSIPDAALSALDCTLISRVSSSTLSYFPPYKKIPLPHIETVGISRNKFNFHYL
nr:MAG TPA: hypothetical protein [Caudoviricetes sp.]